MVKLESLPLKEEEKAEISKILQDLTPEEQKSIDENKYYLSEKSGHDVGIEYAIVDWLRHHSLRWRKVKMRRDMEAQIKKMLEYKWIESEKAGCDLGDKALCDWINKYAQKWREERKVEDIL